MGDIVELRPKGTGGADSTQPPHNGDMEARVKNLEDFAIAAIERLARIETKIDGFDGKFATKEDLQRELHSQTLRFIGAVTTLGLAIIGAMVWIAKNVS